MRLTRKDATATLLIGAIVAVNLAFLDGTSRWLISSARGTTLQRAGNDRCSAGLGHS